MSYTICSRLKGEHIVYAGYTICTSREHIVYGAFCGSTRLVLHVQLRCGSLSITTPISLMANEFDVRSVLHGQVSLAAVNKILCSS